MNTVYLDLPFQSLFSITTDSPELIHLLSLKYGAYVKQTLERSPDFQLSVIKAKTGYDWHSPKESCQIRNPMTEIDRFIFEHNRYHADIFALHGAAIEQNGHCYLFLAPTTSGKTTLTAFLCHHGFGYLTDDCILLSRSTLCVHPYATPIRLRDGGLEILRAYDALPPKLERSDFSPSPGRWLYMPPRRLESPVPLKAVFFLERNEAKNGCIPLSTVEKMTALMKAPITQYAINSEYLQFLSRLAKTDCFRLQYCDMNYVKELLQNDPRFAT